MTLAAGLTPPPAFQDDEDCHLCPGVCVLPGCPYAHQPHDLDPGAAHEPEPDQDTMQRSDDAFWEGIRAQPPRDAEWVEQEAAAGRLIFQEHIRLTRPLRLTIGEQVVSMEQCFLVHAYEPWLEPEE